MTKKEFQKINDAARRIVSKKYGWRQNSYFNWKVEDGYIFTLFCYLYGEASLEVKPLYFDDLWWEITGTFRYEKKPPMSLRCNGSAAICAQKIATYNAVEHDTDRYVTEGLEEIWDGVFKKAETNVRQFLKENPDANTFFTVSAGCRRKICRSWNFTAMRALFSRRITPRMNMCGAFTSRPRTGSCPPTRS